MERHYKNSYFILSILFIHVNNEQCPISKFGIDKTVPACTI